MPLSSQLPRLWLIILVFVVDIHPDVFPVDALGVLVSFTLLAVRQQCGVIVLIVHVFNLKLSVKTVHRFFLSCYVLIIQYLSALSRGCLEFLQIFFNFCQSFYCLGNVGVELASIGKRANSEKCVYCKLDDFVSHSFLLGCCLDYSLIIILIGYLSSPSPLYFVFYFANWLTG